ncbi:hypothetical protein ACFQU1_23320 [Chelatococcus sp. GCM10030263]|uniref:hypothetical protein n=1 Tax=Chelatococcus sp. GCM10030263 TaxID=3273387 RepID=UPI0036230CDB
MKELDGYLTGMVVGGDGTSFGRGLCIVLHTIGKFTLPGLFHAISPVKSLANSLSMQRTLSVASEEKCIKAGNSPQDCQVTPADQLYWMSYMW